MSAEEMRDGIARIQEEMKVSPEFPAAVEAAAEAAAKAPRLPELDRTDIELVTIDPESSMDLDQAMHIERDGDGYVVHYAIADVAAFVSPGDPVDVEANRRGETLYGADSKIPLHPRVLSEGAASLLPDQVCPALLWTIKVDETGEGIDVVVERALVKSRAKLDYASVQADLDAGRADEMFTLLKEVGELRLAREAARGGVSLPLAEQEIVEEDGHWHLEFRQLLPVEEWNAQISLLTGMAAASLMVYARVGVLRTLPPADPRDIQRLHRTARALGVEWPAEQLYPDFIRSLDASLPTPRRDDRGLHPPAARLGLRHVQRRAVPSRRSTPRSPPSTRMSPRHCAGWSIDMRGRSAWHSVPAPRCRSGSSRPCTTCPTRCGSPVDGPTSTRTRSSTSARPSCSPAGSASPSRAWWSRSTRRTRGAVT